MTAKHVGIEPETRREVYEFIRNRPLATRGDVADGLGLSLPTVAKYLTHFLDHGLIEERTRLAPGRRGGRSPGAFAWVPDARCAVGIDVTKTSVTSVVVTLDGVVVAARHTRRPYERSGEYRAFLGDEARAVLAGAEVDAGALLGVGLAMPGLISSAGKVWHGRVIDNLGMTADDFEPSLGLPTTLVHDSDAAGLAEFWARHDISNAFYISLSGSVGGSVIVDGHVFHGDGDYAGEVGHLILGVGGPTCYCGQQGCFDTYCNASVLAETAEGSLDVFFERLVAGEAAALQTWDEYTSHLALAIHNVRLLFGGIVILGGDVGARIRPHMGTIWPKVDRLVSLDDVAFDYLRPCRHTTHSVAVGAALVPIATFLDNPLG